MNFFRFLIISNIVSYLILMLFPFFWQKLYSPETIYLLSQSNSDGVISISGPVPYLMLLGYFISAFGLYNFKDWGRKSYLALLVVNAVLCPFFGVLVQGGFEAIFAYWFGVVSGVILSMAYFSSISTKFK